MRYQGSAGSFTIRSRWLSRARALARRALPLGLQTVIRHRIYPQQAVRDDRLWRLVVSEAVEFSRSEGGSVDAFRQEVVPFIEHLVRHRRTVRFYDEIHQYVLEALLPHYRDHLYDYYREQQYHMFVIMLSYPLCGLGASHVEPYQLARRLLPELRVLDYGAGIPYGLVHTLAEDPSVVSAATLVDLDLVHSRFAEFLLRRTAPGVNLAVHRLRNTDEVPELDGSFNFLFAKDIWEHLRRPRLVLEHLLGSADTDCLCVLDFAHHGAEIHQHITPDICFMSQVMTDAGFRNVATIGGLSVFARGEPLRAYAQMTAESPRL